MHLVKFGGLYWSMRVAGSRRLPPYQAIKPNNPARQLTLPPIHAPRIVRFHQLDLRQPRQGWRKLVPEPDREVFAGGVVEAGNVVELAVVECGVYRLPGGLDVGKIAYPAEFGIKLAADREFDPERMAVQP